MPELERPDAEQEEETMASLLEEEARHLEALAEGRVVEARVIQADAEEVLVDLGESAEGVIPAREMDGPPPEPGAVVLATVIRAAGPDGRAVLSLRRARRERRWRAMQDAFEAGEILEAPVVETNRGGAVVDVGVRGFVPLSQLAEPERVGELAGSRIQVKVLEVEPRRNRLILSQRLARQDVRRRRKESAARRLAIGEVLDGRVSEVTPFGIFVDVGVAEGLVHRSELSWNKVSDPADFAVGGPVRVAVTGVDPDRGRISLSIKRLRTDPWATLAQELRVGDEVEAVVTKLMPFGAFARVREGVEGLIHVSELAPHRVSAPEEVVREGERRQVRVVGIDAERRRLSLSVRQVSGEGRKGNGGPSVDGEQGIP